MCIIKRRVRTVQEGTVSFNLRWTDILVSWIFVCSSRVQVEFCTLEWNKSNIKSAYSQDLLYFRDTEWCTCIIIVFDRKWVMSSSWYYEHCTKVLSQCWNFNIRYYKLKIIDVHYQKEKLTQHCGHKISQGCWTRQHLRWFTSGGGRVVLARQWCMCQLAVRG